MPARVRAHYKGGYAVRARQVREAAYADPLTRCWRCGLTFGEFRSRFPGRHAAWHADHVVPGDPRSPLRAAHASCNTSEGSLNSHGLGLNTSRRWY